MAGIRAYRTQIVVICLLAAIALATPTRADDRGDVDSHPDRADTVNLSHDLVRLGIAAQNLPPDSPTTDARPLVQAALQYAQSHHVRRLTVDRGTYYVLTPENAQAYLLLSAISDLTFDFADSTVLFAGAFLQGFALVNCEHVTLTRLHVDFINPPYTHVQLTAVDPVRRTLSYAVLPPWPDPVAFNTSSPPVATTGPLTVWAMAFRNSDIVPGTSRMPVIQPLTAGALALVQNNAPWTQGPTLSTLLPGDTIVVFVRGGMATISIVGGDSVTVSDATIHGASAQAILFNTSSHSVAERVRVMPRRETGLIAANAGGIILANSGPDSHIRDSFVARTLDDALGISTIDLATVAQQTGPFTLAVDRIAFRRFPNGTKVSFVDPTTGVEVPGPTIVAQDPPDSTPPVFNGPVTVTFDQGLPTLSAGFGMAAADPDARGAGSTIENNVVDDVLFGRGVYIGGTVGLTIAHNRIGRTSDAGIGITQNTNAVAFAAEATPAAHDIIVRDNVVHDSLGPMASGAGSQIALGAIMVSSTNATNRFPAASPNTNITIERNEVTDSGRSGIWVGELDGGAISHNVIAGWDRHPELPLNGVDPQTAAGLLQDFTQPLVVHNSQNVGTRDNVTAGQADH
jgi:hypothetical protein